MKESLFKHIPLVVVVIIGLFVIGLVGYAEMPGIQGSDPLPWFPGAITPGTPEDTSVSPVDTHSKKIKIIDDQTNLPLGMTLVTLYSDNGIRCITTPCPTEGKETYVRTDLGGNVTFKESDFNVQNSISVEGYDGFAFQKPVPGTVYLNPKPGRFSEALKFQGVVKEVNNGCWSDGVCSYLIGRTSGGDIRVEFDRGFWRGQRGYVSGDPVVGSNVEVYATYGESNTMTILGNDSFYIKVL